jgi:hypothetical protein
MTPFSDDDSETEPELAWEAVFAGDIDTYL